MLVFNMLGDAAVQAGVLPLQLAVSTGVICAGIEFVDRPDFCEVPEDAIDQIFTHVAQN